ncbi:MAG: cobalamin B12-binding domain-containing protein, partial [Rhodospirillales bacterium]|nr:cobalamin B12-binding domain-containing protein [Rhodospirillales bacterium]
MLSKSTYSAAILPPLGLAYLASVLRGAGYDVGIVDAQGADIFNIRHSDCGRYYLQGLGIDELVEKIDPATTIVGVSLMFSQEWLPQRDFIQAVRARYPDMVIVVGGEHPTAFPEYVLRDCPEIDYAISGEAEITFLELVHRIFHAKETLDSPGVACIDEKGSLVSNGFSDRITHIDDLPRPAWDLCEVENYFQP